MITKLTTLLLCIFTLYSGVFAGEPDPTIPKVSPGDPALNTSALQFPRSVYYTRMKNAQGQWQTSGTLTEYGKPHEQNGQALMDRIQVQTFNDGRSFLSHRATLVKGSLKPLRNKRESSLPQYQPGFLKSFDVNYDGKHLRGTCDKHEEGEAAFPEKKMEETMFEGDVLGIVLAALPLKKGYQVRLPVMYSQMGVIYTVVAKVVGKKVFLGPDGQSLNAWAVNTDWHDHSNGSVLPGGEAESGGTYYVIPKPPKGYPHVPKYINQSFDTEVIPQLLDP